MDSLLLKGIGMKSIDILCTDTLYAEMLLHELGAAGYNAYIGRSNAPDLIMIDLDTTPLLQGDCVLTFSYDKPADLKRPFDIIEMLELVQRKTKTEDSNAISLNNSAAGLHFSPYGRYAVYNGEKIELSELEYSLLLYLFERKGEIVSAKELSEKVFNDKENPNLVRVYISYLRNKIDEHLGIKMIETVRNKGYMLKG